MQNTWLWIVGIVVVLVGGFIWWQSSQTAPTTVELTPAPTETVNTVPSTPTDTTSTNTTTSQPAPSGTNNGASGTGASSAGAPMSATVTYTADGFTPAEVTIKKGGTVKFVDQRNGSMWVGAGPHPGHAGYDGTSRTTHCAPGYTGAAPFDQCAPGASYSFTFDKVGTWPYHDHMNSSEFGKVVVVE